MSCAVAKRAETGGRRSAHVWPATSFTRKVRFEPPAAINEKSNGGVAPSIWWASHLLTATISRPLMLVSFIAAPFLEAHPLLAQSQVDDTGPCYCSFLMTLTK